ncbi:MAG: hypothetical protein V3V50_09115 [Gammaproteobacteria bacterium]
MKNITLSADDQLIKLAREKARKGQTTLNAEFRRWLQSYVENSDSVEKRVLASRKIIQKIKDQVSIGRKLSREEVNER